MKSHVPRKKTSHSRQASATRRFVISNTTKSQRLDAYLSNALPEFSRAWVHKLIDRGNVVVNGEARKGSYQTKRGDRIRVTIMHPPQIDVGPDPKLKNRVPVVFSNEDFLIVNKPSGMTVHPSRTTPNGTVVNWLLLYDPSIARVGDDPTRPGIVHRLDKDASGLMVIAKNQKTYEWLKAEFKSRRVLKKYLALVHGTLEEHEGRVSYPIGRSKHDPTKQRAWKQLSRAPEDARMAETRYTVLKHFADHTLLEISPITGRMHQIRVHLHAIGHPLCSDRKYTLKGTRELKHLSRLFLHAFYLRFRGPTGEIFSFHAPLPQELETVLKNVPYMVH